MNDIPQYDLFEYRKKQNKYCLCIFVINEGERIIRQLKKMQPYIIQVDVIIADGGSTDGSLDEEILRKNNITTLLVKRSQGALGTQMRMAFDYTLKKGYEGIIVMDGNDKDDPNAIPSFIEALDAGYDHIQGSRYIPGGIEENTPKIRHFAVNWIHAPLIRLSSGFPYTDTTNGFRAYSSRLLRDPRVCVFREVFAGYELHYYLAIRSARLGYKLKEIPVARRYPASGEVPTKISFFKGGIKVILCLLSACMHLYDPPQNKEIVK